MKQEKKEVHGNIKFEKKNYENNKEIIERDVSQNISLYVQREHHYIQSE